MIRPFERITIIGLGLIGGSIARAARKHNIADIIVGCDKDEIALTYARSHKSIDMAIRDPAMAVKNSQMVILATPPSAFDSISREMSPELAPATIVMDTASIKRMPMQVLSASLPLHVDFIPAHPIAGSEKSGMSASSAELFNKCRVIVTPAEPMETHSLKAVTNFWKMLGARVEAMPADMHDTIYAYVSHLPHLLSFAANQILSNQYSSPMQEKFLRLSKSNPDLWSELFYFNQDNLLSALDRYLDAVSHMRHELLQSPEDSKEMDDAQARQRLFPRIAASCLVTTVMEVEKQSGVAFAKFAGKGFKDFTAPASLPPDEDMEGISRNYLAVAGILSEYQELLRRLHDILSNSKSDEIQKAIRPSGNG